TSTRIMARDHPAVAGRRQHRGTHLALRKRRGLLSAVRLSRRERPESAAKAAFRAARVNRRLGWRAALRRSRRKWRGCAESRHELGTNVLPLSTLCGFYIRRNNPWAEPIQGKVSRPFNAQALPARRMNSA